MNSWTVDAHCHWSDERVFARTGTEIPRQVQAGIKGFLLGGVDPEEWARQTELAAKFPGRFWRAFGLHPYFIAAGDTAKLETAWTALERQADSLEAIGETGLDFRKPYLENGKDRQIKFLQQHLALALKVKKPLVLHI